MIAAYHGLGGEKSMHHEFENFELAQPPNVCPRGWGLKDLKNSKIRASKFYSDGKFEIVWKCAPMNNSHYTIIDTLAILALSTKKF